MEVVLSAKSSNLCFNKDDFMANDFSVDKFVSNYRKYVSLETLLGDLSVYHRILCSAVIELINSHYADFLNLSSNLVGLDKSIQTLCLPLEKLATRIHDMAMNLHETLQHVNTLFHTYSAAHKMKVLNNNALCFQESLKKLENLKSLQSQRPDDKIPLDELERMALDFNILHFHMKSLLKKLSFNYLKNQNEVVQDVTDCLRNNLAMHFILCLTEDDYTCLPRILRIYTVVNMESELEDLFAEVYIKPFMEECITEENILRYGLKWIYDQILCFIDTTSDVLDATRGIKKSTEIVPGFDILVNSVFPQIVYSFNLINPVHIYPHGNPELFHENYNSTIIFLNQFERLCQIQTSVQRLRNQECFISFLKKWNIDLYFQIRFSEIAGRFEKCLLEGFIYDTSKEKKGTSYLLNICHILSECVKLCYHEKIFLKALSHSFFRLNLKLISRFYKAACEYLKCDDEDTMNAVDAAVVIKDVEVLITELKKLFEQKVIQKVPRDVVEVAYQQSSKLLQDIIPLASSIMIRCLTKQCCLHLKLISDIPRLYRKTNREVPSKPSNYVALVFDNLTAFITETESILPIKSKRFCLQEVTNGIIIQCVIMISDVLTAIEKMEHSLKILKRARDKNSAGGPSGMTDDMKIRLQLKIDILAVEEKARELELDIDNLKSFKELKDLIKSTETILPHNF